MALWRIAETLSRRAVEWKRPSSSSARVGRQPALPPLLFVTDPLRTPDPGAVMEGLPRGCGVIYRAFGAPDALDVARALRRIADRRGLVLLIGADETLAARAGADGVHLPQRALACGRQLRARRPRWLITGAAHDARALNLAARSSLDAALLSAAFASRSRSAGRPLGPVRVTALTRHAALPVYALGGINSVTAKRLSLSRVVGLAAVGTLIGPEP